MPRIIPPAYPNSPPGETAAPCLTGLAIRGLAAGLLLCGSATGARAQILENYLPAQVLGTDTFLQQPPSDYTPKGVRVGSFILHPEVQETVGYDSNVLGLAGGAGSPRIETSATVDAASDWDRNAMSAYVNVDNVQTPSVGNASYTNYVASLAGSLDIGRDTLRGSYTYLKYNLLPGDTGNLGLTQVLPVTTNDLRGEYAMPLGRVTIVPSIDINTYRYDAAGGGSTALSYVYQNRNVYTGAVTTRYELAPQRDLVFVLRGSTAQYETEQPGLPGRNYLDLQALAGLDFAANGVIRYRALLGYETRNYNSAQIPNSTTPVAEAAAIWTPTRLTTVRAVITHQLEDSLEGNIYSYNYTQFRVTVDHQLYRNVLLEAYGSIQDANYGQQGGVQTTYGGGASVAWLLNRNVQLRASVDLTDSRAPAPSDYTRNVFLLQLRFQL